MSDRPATFLTLHASHPLCISHLLAERAERTPEAPALLAPGRASLTYSHLRQHVDAVVRRLHAIGVRRGDRVAVVLPNGPEMAVAALAVAAGAVCAPLNPAYGVREFDFYLAALRAKALIVQAETDSPARAVALARDISIIELSPRREAEAGCFTLIPEVRENPAPCGLAKPEDIAIVLHTSGTTARPKLVPLTHANICRRAHHKCVAHQLDEGDRCLNVMPLCHGHGLINTLLTSLMAGASVVCLAGFEASNFFVWMKEFCPTWYSASPTIHQAILTQATFERQAIERCLLRFIRSGTAPLPPQVLAELERLFKAPVTETYGLTETSMITYNPLPPRERKAGSVGIAMGTEVAIMDEKGAVLSAGETGEVVVRGATVMEGYENDPAANSDAFTHGWFRSGDAGYLDADGYLFLTGRIKEIINRGGEKIAPQEVDDILISHPSVAQAATFAVPHARLGEDVAAAVVLHENASVTASDLRQFVATRLAAFKVPSQVLIVNDIPKHPISGKLQRHDLADRLRLSVGDHGQRAMAAGLAFPHTPVEEVLIGLWVQVLGLDDVGVHDNFSSLGGDSILATQLIARVRDVMHVEISFRSFFEAPTVADMASRIEAASQTTLGLEVPPLQPVPRDGPLPLSYAQQRLWFLEQLEPSRAVYNLPLAWHFTGDLSLPVLEQSLGEMVRRHEVLRTTFASVHGQPAQMIASNFALPLPMVDLQVLPASEREAAVQRLATEEARCPFDLAHGPLIRATLLRMSGEDHVLLLTLHHIIFDGWSAEVFWDELAALYTTIRNGRSPSLQALPLQYTDFAVWQRQWLQGEVLAAQLAYWKQQLGDTLPVLELPVDRPRPPVQTFQGARQPMVIPAPLTSALKVLSQQEGGTLFMALVAAFQTLLCRYTGQTDLVVGTPVTGRTRVETEGLLGFFVNILVLRTDLSGNPRFREVLRRVREVTLGAYDHQELPFEKLVEALQPARDLSHHPLVQVMIALQPSLPPVAEFGDLTVRRLAVNSGTAKFDLTLSFQDTEQGLLATVEYNTDLFDRTTITRLLNHFQTLLESIVADPEQRLGDLPLLTEAERRQLLVEWNDSTTDYPPATCVHQLFEAQVEQKPDAVAVVFAGEQLTYGALNRRANQLAHQLRALGVGPEVCVGICVERSIEMVVGILGILKAGGAYVPLDPAYPIARLATMIAQAGVRVLATLQRYMAMLPAENLCVVCLDTDSERIAQQGEMNPASGATPENLAYVMYTSGATGTPKGVMVEHRQVLAFLYSFERVAPAGKSCVGTAVCPFGFDVSVWECLSMLCFGGTLHILMSEILTHPEQLVHYLTKHRVMSAYIPPALLSDVADCLEHQHEQMALRRLLVGVEPILQGTLQRFRNFSGQMHLVNGYGPTETTVCATLFPFEVSTDPDRRTPIGTRMHGYEVYLVDASLQPVPIRIPSELLIGGAGLSRGYINHRELTAEHFVPHPYSNVPGARLYKTGDWACYLPNGNLEFLGRRDQQVKIRGYRVELEEIGSALRQHPAIQDTVVLIREDARHSDKHLVAYVVAKRELDAASNTLRTFLKQKLPEYMVPSAFVMLEALPRTPNGKIDRRALPLPDPRQPPSATPFVAPRTFIESTLAGIWADVLGLERVGAHDNFFELGGDSIQSIQIVARANQKGFRLTPKHLFQHQTIAELSIVAGTLPTAHADQGMVTGPVPLTPIQHWFFEQDLPDLHHWNQAILLEVRQRLDWAVLERVVQHLLMHHDMLRARFRRTSDGWQQEILSAEASSLCVRVDLSALPEEQQSRVIAETAGQLQASLNLIEGPVARVALFDCGPQKSARLLVVIHHLLVDNVSWRILLEDLQMAYQQLSADMSIGLPPKTTSFKHWAEHLTAYAQSTELWQELSYWLATPHVRVDRLPVDYPGGINTEASARTLSVSLSTKETDALLQEIPRAYRTLINDVLLTALGQAFARWIGEQALLIDLEGHGREEVVGGIDLSRTVGWFTTIFPVLLQLRHACTPAEALKSVKEQLRRIPKRGIGYGVLYYLSQDTAVTGQLWTLPRAEVCFNYLGRTDQVVSGPVFFGPIPEARGSNRSPHGNRRYLLEINARLVSGQLHCDWTYSERLHRRDTIAGLAQGFMEALHALIMHCQSPSAGDFTPSDFPKMKLSQEELDELITALGEAAEGD